MVSQSDFHIAIMDRSSSKSGASKRCAPKMATVRNSKRKMWKRIKLGSFAKKFGRKCKRVIVYTLGGIARRFDVGTTVREVIDDDASIASSPSFRRLWVLVAGPDGRILNNAEVLLADDNAACGLRYVIRRMIDGG